MAVPFDAPARNAAAVTPSDTTIIACRGVYVGGAGNLVCDFGDGGNTNVTFSAVPAGTVLPIMPLRIKAATTATNIVALY